MDLKQEYITEVKGILKSLEQSVMQLETRKNDIDEINNIYRYLHTLKGSAGMFGYDQVERLSHEMEHLFSDIRDGLRTQDDYILDLTLHAVDIFEDLIEGNNAEDEVEKIIKDIHVLCDKEENSGAQANSANPSPGVLEAFVVLITPDDNIFNRGINLQAILEELQELGNAEIKIHNESIPFEKQLKDKKISSWIEVLLVTDQGKEAIDDVFLFLNDKEYSIIHLENEQIFHGEKYQQHLVLSEEQIEERVAFIAQHAPDVFKLQDTEAEITVELEQEENTTGDEAEDDTITSKRRDKNSHVSVSTQKLDHMINIVSELVTFRSELQHLMQGQKNHRITEAIEKLDRLTLRLRDSAFNIRLVPLNIIKVKLQRLIRTISKDLGKEIEFITDGLDTELDRSMINALEAPLMHIIRNAIDHGIETPEERLKSNKQSTGLLKLSSYNSGDHVFIQIQDDGRGIDFNKIRAKGTEQGLLSKHQNYSEKELLNVMMMPGFSTADKVTKVSGRGVGMDVVKRDINSLRGELEISTEEGLGSIFTIRLPLTLTVLDTLVVNISDNKYLIPINEIEYCYEVSHEKLFEKKSRQIQYKGQLTPFVSLREFFGKEEFPENETVVVVNKNDTKVAVVVDGIIGKLQTVYKPLNELLQNIDCFSGASILGDGSTALILNALKLHN